MQAMKLPEVMTIVPTSEAETKALVSYLVDYADNGDVNPLDLECMFNRLLKTIEYVRDNERYKAAVNAETTKYAEQKFNFNRFTIQKSSRSSYEYKGDYVWNELDAKKKAREELLKTLKEPMFDESGVQIVPAIKRTTEFLTIKPLE